MSDYKHHPDDVLGGTVIGVFIGVVVYWVVTRRLFPVNEEVKTSCEDDRIEIGLNTNEGEFSVES